MEDKFLEHLELQANDLARRWRDKKRNAKGWNAHKRSLAVEIGEVNGHEYWIVRNPMWKERERLEKENPKLAKDLNSVMPIGYNGYVVFKEKPVSEPEYGGILTYVPVHGGITYAHSDEIGTVYGFDTSHVNSGQRPIDSLAWIKNQCALMICGIKKAAELEIRYLGEHDKQKRAFIAQQVWDIGGKQEFNLGVNLNLLFGEI